ncbi:MAG: RNA polymerase sigma factor [Peptostreptococcaceae bacterium]|nr:RNA polymerase sigma factor [Peptostreptococcaceae bacterium]
MEQDAKRIRRILRKNDREAADELIREYYDEIFRFAYRQLGSREEALDAAQNIFLAMLRALPSYDESKGGFRTWLYRIAVNKIIDSRRRKIRTFLPLKEDTAFQEEDLFLRLSDRLLLEQIERYVSSFSPDIQSVFRLRLYAGLHFRQIADSLRQSESAVKTKYYRLVSKIRKEFEDYEKR